FRMVEGGRTPGLRTAIFCANVSATEVSGSSTVMIARRSRMAFESKDLDAEDPGVTRLDCTGLLLHRHRIVLQRLDVLERRPARLFFCLRMCRAQTADVDDELLGFAAEAVGLEQPGRIRIGRILEDAVRP